jgi:hypothetical protein
MSSAYMPANPSPCSPEIRALGDGDEVRSMLCVLMTAGRSGAG